MKSFQESIESIGKPKKYFYDLLQCPSETEEAVRIMSEDLFPLFREYWEREAKERFGSPLSLQATEMVLMWNQHILHIFTSRDTTGRLVGFLLAFVSRPMFYESRILSVQHSYLPNVEMKNGMMEYLNAVLKYVSCDEIHIPVGEDCTESPLSGNPHRYEVWCCYKR